MGGNSFRLGNNSVNSPGYRGVGSVRAANEIVSGIETNPRNPFVPMLYIGFREVLGKWKMFIFKQKLFSLCITINFLSCR